jgi:hypothetical protein
MTVALLENREYQGSALACANRRSDRIAVESERVDIGVPRAC